MTDTPQPPTPPSTPPPSGGPQLPAVVAALLLLGLLFGWNVSREEFLRPDEVRIAAVSRTMERSGDWLIPRVGGRICLDVPPLGYWLPAATHRLTGLDPRVAYRLPGLIAAVAGLALTYLAGRRLFSGRIGFLAMMLQASTWSWFSRASWLDDDLLFAVFVQLAITAFAVLTRKGAGRGWGVLGWLGLAGCALTKSALLGFALVGGVLLFFLFFEGGLDAVRLGIRRVRRWPGILLFILLVAPWYVLASASEGAALLRDHVLGQHLDRLFGATYDAMPPYFYLLVVAVGFLPWTLLLPLGILHSKDRAGRHGERLCLSWLFFILVALTFVSSKKSGYILPVWPPLSLAIAAALFETKDWYSLWEDYLREGVLKVFPLLLKVPLFLVLIAAGLYLCGAFDGSSDPRVRALLADRPSVLRALGLAGAAGALLFLVSAPRVRRFVREGDVSRAAFEVACATLFILFVWGFSFDARNALFSGRAVLERFRSEVPQSAPLAVYGRLEPEIVYWLDRDLAHLGYPDPRARDDPRLLQLETFLRQPSAAYLVTTREELRALRQQFASLDALLNIRDEGLAGRLEYVLVSNRPGP